MGRERAADVDGVSRFRLRVADRRSLLVAAPILFGLMVACGGPDPDDPPDGALALESGTPPWDAAGVDGGDPALDGATSPDGATPLDGGAPTGGGWTTFEPDETSRVIYVSNEGDDGNDGLSPEAPVRTLVHGADLVRDGHYDFLLLRRGDRFTERLGDFKSGRDAEHPLVIASYGDAEARPLLDYDGAVINHNGRERSYLAIMDLHFRPAGKIPPGNGEDIGAALRLVGGGEYILIEGCHLEYTELVVQSFGDGPGYRDVRVRRNVFERSYQPNLCIEGNLNGDSRTRPSGIFSSGIERFSIEENVFDHNGWNRDRVPSACATIYNHNVYLTRSRDLRVVGNVFARASSIHIKLTGTVEEPTDGYTIENNYFVGGEIGISAGGNSEGPARFTGGRIRHNVLADIGISPPTGRSLAWGVEIIENQDTVVEHNIWLANHTVGNSWALQITNRSNDDVRVANNIFFRIPSRALWARRTATHTGVEVVANTFVDPGLDACLIRQDDGFGGYTYRDNAYYAAGSVDRWFCEGSTRRSFAEWVEQSGEAGARALDEIPFTDPERSIESYAASLGLEATLEAYLEAARAQSRESWREELGADAINRYIRAGFE